jgi:hypothetical protein
MLEKIVKRIVRRLFPELTGGLHLSLWGQVINAPVPITEAMESTDEQPGYCVDVQLLGANGKPDTAMPLMEKVPLPVTGIGAERGLFAFPQPGALVELGFVMGLPHRPFIRSVFARGELLPKLGAADVLLAQDAANYYRIDDKGNINEQCQAVAERFAKLKQRLVVKDGGTVWLGNESSNVLRILDELIKVTSAIANTAATHIHEYTDNGTKLKTKAPDQAGEFSGQKSDADKLDSELAPIVG